MGSYQSMGDSPSYGFKMITIKASNHNFCYGDITVWEEWNTILISLNIWVWALVLKLVKLADVSTLMKSQIAFKCSF